MATADIDVSTADFAARPEAFLLKHQAKRLVTGPS